MKVVHKFFASKKFGIPFGILIAIGAAALGLYWAGVPMYIVIGVSKAIFVFALIAGGITIAGVYGDKGK